MVMVYLYIILHHFSSLLLPQPISPPAQFVSVTSCGDFPRGCAHDDRPLRKDRKRYHRLTHQLPYSDSFFTVLGYLTLLLPANRTAYSVHFPIQNILVGQVAGDHGVDIVRDPLLAQFFLNSANNSRGGIG